MANAADKKSVIIENLRDMGLNDETIFKCMTLFDEKNYSELEKFLKSYRQTLLDNIHMYNDRIDCLDYFTYKHLRNGGI
ncbi:MAG TPA: hypothetical protein DCG28_01230 [Lachnospiraceae bacterium]|nr:hypothetical protein [Lachnospiraceae bacterium]